MGLDPGASAYTLLPAVTTNSLLDSGLSPGAAYSYYIKSANSAGLSAASPTVSLRFPPAVPTGLAVASVTSTTVTLSWNPSSGATSYAIFRKDPNDSSFQLIPIGGTGTQATDTGLTPKATYYYAVRAGNTSDNSALSGAISATPFLPIPNNLSVTNTTATTVSLSWSPSSEATGYYILRKDPGQSTFTQIGSTASNSSTTFHDTGLQFGATYLYAVQAFNAVTYSDPSDPIPAVPALAVPSNLTVTGSTSSSIAIAWTASAEATGFTVFREGPGDTSFHQIGTTQVPTFTDSSLAEDSVYSYYVLATASMGSSGASTTLSATTGSQHPPSQSPIRCRATKSR